MTNDEREKIAEMIKETEASAFWLGLVVGSILTMLALPLVLGFLGALTP